MTDLVARAVLVLVMAGSGLLLVWVARATATGRLGRNPFAGIRVSATMTSDAAWWAAHRRARRSTELGGACAALSALPALTPVPMSVVAASVGFGCVAMLGCVLHGAIAGIRAAEAVTRAGEPPQPP